ncbi:MAG: LacI family DNA-binding transcriptional regulator [Pseudomonadota bacterium]
MKKSDTPALDRKPTQRTVADAAGFAVTTVSRALAGDPLIAEKTRAKISEVARELGYEPDRAAQRLRTGRTNVIALVLDPHGEILDFAGTMVTGFAEVVRDTRYHLNLTQYQLGEDPMRPIRHIVRNRLADGVVFARTEPQDKRVEYLLEAGFPFVTHGRTNLASHAWYDYDNATFAHQAVDRLIAKGRRRILIIPPATRYSFSTHMMEGFRTALAQQDDARQIPVDFDLNSPASEIYEKLKVRFTQPDAPDGVICPGEIAAMAALAAIEDQDLALGKDIDVVAKQTSQVFDLHRPRIETIHEDIEAAGRVMAKLLLAEIDGASTHTRQILQSPATPSSGF